MAATAHGQRGFLLAFEGIDGAGKSTMVAKLAAALEARKVPLATALEPTYASAAGKALRAAMTAPDRLPVPIELELFRLDRKWHYQHILKPNLSHGSLVILDRYYLSSAVYQGSVDGRVREVLELCEGDVPAPDLWVLLDVDVAAAMERLQMTRGGLTAFEKEKTLQRCRDAYLSLVENIETSPTIGGRPAVVVHARDSLEEVFQRIVLQLELLQSWWKSRGQPWPFEAEEGR